MNDFGDRFRKVKEIINFPISEIISNDIMYKTYDGLSSEKADCKLVFFGITRNAQVINKNSIVTLRASELFPGEVKFNMRRFKLLSSSARLEVTSKVLEEL